MCLPQPLILTLCILHSCPHFLILYPLFSPWWSAQISWGYILRRSPHRGFSPPSIMAGGGAALCGVKSLWFLYLVRLLAAVLTITSTISRRILSPYITKEVLMSIKTIEGESSDPSRANYVTDFPRDLFPTYAWANVSGTLTGVEILVSMAIIGKLLNTFFTPCWPDRLYAWYPELNRDYCCKFHSGGGGI